MKPARILLLVVAIVAGGMAAFLATRGQGPTPVEVQQVTQMVEEQKAQVLVAATTIGVGERLTKNSVMWQDWPETAIRPEYVTAQNLPDAPEQMDGTIARFEIFAGEPIRAAKLVRTDQGYLSAVISQGMRGVSIPVTAASGAGGFIVPNDRVDVVQTSDDNAGGPISSTILANVRVLAIGQRLGQTGQNGGAAEGEQDPTVQTFDDKTIATLELDPFQSEIIVAAAANGQLTLVLRSVVDFSETQPAQRRTDNQSITLIKFGAQTSVQSNIQADNDYQPSAESEELASATLESVVQPLFQQAGLTDPSTEQETPGAPPPARQ